MDNRLTQDALIEDALISQPLALMPRSITGEVMASIRKDMRPAILAWSDFVLSTVIAACIAALWFASQYVPPIYLAKLKIQGILLHQAFLVNGRWLVPVMMFGLAAFFAALTIPTLYKMAVDRNYGSSQARP